VPLTMNSMKIGKRNNKRAGLTLEEPRSQPKRSWVARELFDGRQKGRTPQKGKRKKKKAHSKKKKAMSVSNLKSETTIPEKATKKSRNRAGVRIKGENKKR